MIAPDLKAALAIPQDVKVWKAPRRAHGPVFWLCFGVFALFAISFAGERDYQDKINAAARTVSQYPEQRGESPPQAASAAPIALIPAAPHLQMLHPLHSGDYCAQFRDAGKAWSPLKCGKAEYERKK